jgi:hypothetical protein
MPKWLLVAAIFLSISSIYLVAEQIANGQFPYSLANLFLMAAVVLEQPGPKRALGNLSKALAYGCLGIAMVIVVLQVTGRGSDDGWRAGDADEPVVKEAVQATARFHRALSEGRYDEICGIARLSAFRSVTEQSCDEFLTNLHGRLGGYRDGSPGRVQVSKGSPTPRVAFDVTSQYERAEAKESFNWQILAGARAGRPDLVSYHVNF